MGANSRAEAGAAGVGGRRGTTERLLPPRATPVLEASGVPLSHLFAIISPPPRPLPASYLEPLQSLEEAEIAARQGRGANYRKMRTTATSRQSQGQLLPHSLVAQCPPCLVQSPKCGPLNRLGLSPSAPRVYLDCRPGARTTTREPSLPPCEEREQFKVTSHFHRRERRQKRQSPHPRHHRSSAYLLAFGPVSFKHFRSLKPRASTRGFYLPQNQ